MQKRFDHIVLGIVLGIIAPICGMFAYYLFTYRSQASFGTFIEYFKSVHLFVASISLSCYITNLPIFFLFLWKENYKTARGILFATVAYTVWVMYQKMF
jgi:hypothetical protein